MNKMSKEFSLWNIVVFLIVLFSCFRTTTDGVRQSPEEKETRVSPIIHSTNENSKKIDHSTRLKLSKSVSFSLEKSLLNQRLAKETSKTFLFSKSKEKSLL